MVMPSVGLERSQHDRAHPTKRYMAGARGQPCLTSASHCIGCDTWPLTTAVAQVLLRRVLAHSNMPPPAPTASMTPKRKGLETVSYALLKLRKTAAGGGEVGWGGEGVDVHGREVDGSWQVVE